ncbi:ATP-dependent DNA ligase [Panacibacter ginsenosidivorans]|uniref:DNA ligase (ATP) n=1 Tax=Panacibacter ginsenosidivorans TaxID=1813871 RepID=A0A5B8VF67_9BACT|nr:ATP-dependent DNA ligase [Panacibacter ginsenosidivorans]QEC69959.1 ATP-dependent DNA ligase [Panacibacter ginsenosidivorans]
MKQFSALVQILGTSTKTNDKLNALSQYFLEATNSDKVWVIALFSGRRPKRIINATRLSEWCCEITGLPFWLFEESYHTVGDLAETIALLLPETDKEKVLQENSLTYYLQQLVILEKADEEIKKQFITECWMQMTIEEKFVFNKLLTGGFRIGVSQKTIVNALAKTVNADPAVIAHRISGKWNPSTTDLNELLSEEQGSLDNSKPYPFYLAYALETAPDALGEPHEWQAEWKWDGIRGQIIKRKNELFVWSRGEELMTEKFPEYFILKETLPNGIVLDGEIMPFRKEDAQQSLLHSNISILPFAVLQTRIGRKNVTKKQLQEAPVAFFAYDILEYEGIDIRYKTMAERRTLLEQIVLQINNATLQLSPVIDFENWDALTKQREQSRSINAEGIMLKRKSSAYQVGRKVGDWWKWKIDALTIDAVMIYAQKGHGRRSNLYTDYTFAVKDGDKLVSFTKAYSGLTDKEFAQVDAFVKRNAIEKFGPVRTVKPALVFEIAFEGIAASNRHKSGVALRFPRIHRWRKDKKADEINTLGDLKKLLELYGK